MVINLHIYCYGLEVNNNLARADTIKLLDIYLRLQKTISTCCFCYNYQILFITFRCEFVV